MREYQFVGLHLLSYTKNNEIGQYNKIVDFLFLLI